MAGKRAYHRSKSVPRYVGGRHFSIANRNQNSPVHAKRLGSFEHKGRKPVFSRLPVIVVSSVMVIVCAIILARGFGLFNLTMGALNVTSSTAPVSDEGLTSQSSEPVPTATPEPTPVPDPTLAPPEGGAAYTKKYTDMWVPKSEYSPHAEGDKVVYLTFDDGPCGSSQRLLDVLDELEVKATFFVTAQFMDGDGLIREIKDAYKRGHAVGVHTFQHDYKNIYSSVEVFLDDYKKMDDIILEATGVRSSIFRFPGGSNTGYSTGIRNELLAEMTRRGFIYHDWNAYNGDSDGFGYDGQIEKAVKEASYNERSVILLHNTPDKDTVIDTLYKIIPKLRDKGYRFDVLDETVKPIQFIKSEENPPSGESEKESGQGQSQDGQQSGRKDHGDTGQNHPQNSEPSDKLEDPQG